MNSDANTLTPASANTTAHAPARSPSECIGCCCGECGHVWIVAYLPMDLRNVGRAAKNAMCPMCANRKPRLAKTEQLEALLREASNG